MANGATPAQKITEAPHIGTEAPHIGSKIITFITSYFERLGVIDLPWDNEKNVTKFENVSNLTNQINKMSDES